jgi:hypothetical protein
MTGDLVCLALVLLCLLGLIDCRRRLYQLEVRILKGQIRAEKESGRLDKVQNHGGSHP